MLRLDDQIMFPVLSGATDSGVFGHKACLGEETRPVYAGPERLACGS